MSSLLPSDTQKIPRLHEDSMADYYSQSLTSPLASKSFHLRSNNLLKAPTQRAYHQNARPSILHRPNFLPYTFIAICCGGCALGCYAKQESQRGRSALRNLITKYAACSLQNIREGRYYTMITSSFMHFSPIHLACNMVGLYSFGPLIVMSFGPATFLVAWIGGSIACDSALLYWDSMKEKPASQYQQTKSASSGMSNVWRRNPDADLQAPQTHAVAIGASGSICALLGVFVGLSPTAKIQMFLLPPLPAWIAMAGFTAASVYCMSENLFPFIGHAGHLGGLGFGLAYYYGRLRPWIRRL